MRRYSVALIVLALSAAPSALSGALAGESADLTRGALESGGFSAGLAQIQSRADDEALFGAAMLKLAQTLQTYAQAQYRYGLQAPRGLALPFLRLPLPPNPAPEAISYDKQRAALQAFLDGLGDVDATIARMKGGEIKIPVDLNAVAFDLTGTGKPEHRATLGQIMAQLRMTRAQSEPFEVAFDRGDALWLRGYANLLSALLQFTLAHDWRESFDISAHLFYPASPSLFQPGVESAESKRMEMIGERTSIADLIAFVHSIHWNVAEPERLKKAHGHLKQVVALSRESWKAILAETDDDREWIPNPNQTNAAVRALGPVTQARIDGWLAALDQFDAVLDGRKLIPHWRFNGGINFKRMLLEPRPFDPVMIATGHALAPYVESGQALDWETWRQWQQVFGGNFLGFAAWFN